MPDQSIGLIDDFPTRLPAEPNRNRNRTAAMLATPTLLSPSEGSVLSWDSARVVDWLCDINCGQYESLFRENDIDGNTLIECDQAILREIGIEKVGDRVRILSAIRRLRDQTREENVRALGRESTWTSHDNKRSSVDSFVPLGSGRYSPTEPDAPVLHPPTNPNPNPNPTFSSSRVYDLPHHFHHFTTRTPTSAPQSPIWESLAAAADRPRNYDAITKRYPPNPTVVAGDYPASKLAVPLPLPEEPQAPYTPKPTTANTTTTTTTTNTNSMDGTSMSQLPTGVPFIRVIHTGGQTKVLDIKGKQTAEEILASCLRKLGIPEREKANYCFYSLNGTEPVRENCQRLSNHELVSICASLTRPERARLIFRNIQAGLPEQDQVERAAIFASSEVNHSPPGASSNAPGTGASTPATATAVPSAATTANNTAHNTINGANMRYQSKLQKLTGESWQSLQQPLSPFALHSDRGKDSPTSSKFHFSDRADRQNKLRALFGTRPPSEMIIHELSSFFPTHHKEDIEKTVRLSARRSKRMSRAANRLSVMSNYSYASTVKDVPPMPNVASNWFADDNNNKPTIVRPLSVSRNSIPTLSSAVYQPESTSPQSLSTLREESLNKKREAMEIRRPESDVSIESFGMANEAAAGEGGSEDDNHTEVASLKSDGGKSLTSDAVTISGERGLSSDAVTISDAEGGLTSDSATISDSATVISDLGSAAAIEPDALTVNSDSKSSWKERLSMLMSEDGEEEDDVLKAFLAGDNFSEKQWMKGSLIGEGSFGSVYLALHAITGELMAVKQVEVPSASKDAEIDKRKNAMVNALKHEIDLLQGLQHPNIVEYLGTFTDDKYLNIFLEYVPGGSIATMLRQYNTFQEPLIKNFVRQILNGLSYLHSKDIIHRDIKGANILVDNKGCIKISDFGISKRSTVGGAGGTKAQRASLQGSVFWMAPEVVKQKEPQTKKADIWSLGCLVVEMFIGSHPFPTHTQAQAIFAIGNDERPPPPSDASAEAVEFLDMTFRKEIDKRPSADELAECAFLKAGS